jgi:hypothetical protein
MMLLRLCLLNFIIFKIYRNSEYAIYLEDGEWISINLEAVLY